MKYKLTIIKYEENKNFEAELAKFKEKERIRYPSKPWEEGQTEELRKETAERSLEVFLTEEEYKKVKEEVIKIFQ